jgi:hypothetical protein
MVSDGNPLVAFLQQHQGRAGAIEGWPASLLLREPAQRLLAADYSNDILRPTWKNSPKPSRS